MSAQPSGIKRNFGFRPHLVGNKNSLRHGRSFHPGYWVWRGILARCRNPKARQFKNYGGRGIGIAPEWQSFEDFWRDMGPTWVEGLTIERRDNNGDYGPENCIWAPWKVQARNKRTSRLVATPWGEMTVAEAAEKHNLNRYFTEKLYGIRSW